MAAPPPNLPNTVAARQQVLDENPILKLFEGVEASTVHLLQSLNLLDARVDLMGGDTPDHMDRDEGVRQFLKTFGVRLQRLSKKEWEVVLEVLDGLTNKAMSKKLNVSQRAIELRKSSAMSKCGVKSHTELIRQVTKFQVLVQHYRLFYRDASFGCHLPSPLLPHVGDDAGC